MVVMLPAQAATSGSATFGCLQLSVTSGGTVGVEATTTGFKITAYGTDGACSSTYEKEVTCEITNTGTKDDGSVRAVSFTITTSGMKTDASNERKTLDSSTLSLTYTGTSGKGSAAFTTLTITITDIEQESVGSTVTTTVKPGTGGTITVDETAVTAQTDFSNLDDHTYTLTAKASSGYEFFGWMSSGGPINTDGSASVSYAGKNAATVWPLFVKTGSAIYYIQGASPAVYYSYLDEAVTAAGTSDTIVPYRGGTVYGASSNTIALSGQTLLLPISATDLTIDTSTSTDDSGSLASTWIHANVAYTSDQYDDGNVSNSSVKGVMEPDTSVYLTLTVPKEITINVNSGSKLVIGGTIVSGTTQTGGVCGATAGAHSNLIVDGTLNINSGGVLSACGYVLGSGSVNIVGGSAYQPFVLMDYHDGHYTANSTKNGNFPAYRYIMQNIRPKITISSSGKMYGYIDVYTQETNVYITTIKARHNVDCQLIIGTSSDTQCLIKLARGATLTATYDATDYVTTTSNKAGSAYYSKAGKTHLTINGGATMGYLSISVYVPIVGSQTSNSHETDFPVPYHYDITLENGEYTLPYSLVLFPGASMTVAESAKLVVSANKFVVLDGLHDHSSRSSSITVGSWYEYHYPSTENFQKNHSLGTYNGTANFVVDGTFTVNSDAFFGGYIQTNGTGTVVVNGTPSATAGVGNVTTYGSPVNEYVGRTEHTLKAWLWEADGDLLEITSGTTYYGVDAATHNVATYDYVVYTSPNSTDSTEVNDDTLDADITGSWCTIKGHGYDAEVTTEATCKSNGEMTYTCSGCGHSYTESIGFLFYAANVRLGNNLDMMFAFSKEAVKDWTGYYVKVVRTRADGTVDDPVKYDTSTWTTNGEYYVVTYSGIAAKEMCDTLALTIYDGDGNAVSSTWTDSIRSYALRILSKTSNDYLPTVIVDMLNYGAACQAYFKYPVEDPTGDQLATYGLSADQQALASGDPKVADNWCNCSSDSETHTCRKYWAGTTLVVQSNILCRVAFSGLSDDMYISYSFEGHKGNKVESEQIRVDTLPTSTTNGGNPYVEISDLVVADARYGITFTIYAADQKTPIAQWQDSIEAYVCRKAKDTNQAVYTALMKFADSAYTYLHNK